MMHRKQFPGLMLLAALALPPALPAAADVRATAAAEQGGVEIERVWTAHRDARSFVRMSEYRTGREDPGGAMILRSQPEVRDGFYFTIRVTAAEAATLPDGTIVLHVVAPDAAEPRKFSFPFKAGGLRSIHFEVGLTGADWPHGKTMPLAWKLVIEDGAGALLASRQSFLWEKPTAAASSS